MKKAGRSGQVMVEMLLILPVFLTIIFSIMEIGYISFQLILLNHATYEVARIGGMTTTSPPGHSCGKLDEIMKTIILSASVSCGTEKTLTDPQAVAAGQSRPDHHGEQQDQAHISDQQRDSPKPRGMGTRLIQAVVRMPIESPLIK